LTTASATKCLLYEAKKEIVEEIGGNRKQKEKSENKL
jgi:hypothetical protein